VRRARAHARGAEGGLQVIAASSPGHCYFTAWQARTGPAHRPVMLALADVVPDAIAYDYAVSGENCARLTCNATSTAIPRHSRGGEMPRGRRAQHAQLPRAASRNPHLP